MPRNPSANILELCYGGKAFRSFEAATTFEAALIALCETYHLTVRWSGADLTTMVRSLSFVAEHNEGVDV